MPLHAGPNLGRMSDSKERKRLKKLKAMVSYRKRKGHCALLHRKSKNRRIQVTPEYQGPVKEIKLPVCTFSEGEQMCTKPCVPLVKFCMERILAHIMPMCISVACICEMDGMWKFLTRISCFVFAFFYITQTLEVNVIGFGVVTSLPLKNTLSRDAEIFEMLMSVMFVVMSANSNRSAKKPIKWFSSMNIC